MMVCPTERVGTAELAEVDLVVLAAACGAAKTGVSAPDIARSATTIPTAAPAVAIFVLAVFIFFSSFFTNGWNLFIGKERSVSTWRIYAGYSRMKSFKKTSAG